MENCREWKKYISVAWAIVETFLFGGLVFGWASLVFVFKQERIYADLCGKNNRTETSSLYGESCKINHTAAVGNMSRCNLTDFGNEVEDSTTICLAQDAKFNLAFTIAASISTVIAVIFGEIHYKLGTRITRILMMLMFMTGSLMLAFVTKGGIAFENGISRKSSYLFLTALHSMVAVSTFAFLPKMFITNTTDTEMKKPDGKNERNAHISSPEMSDRQSLPTLKACMLSATFLLHVFWMSTLQLGFQYFLSTLNFLLTRRFKEENIVSYYTNVYALIMMGGCVFSVVAGIIYDWQRRIFRDSKCREKRELMPAVLPLCITCFFAILMYVLVLLPQPEVLYFTFSCVCILRSFLYTMAAGYLGAVFPSEYLGILFGVMLFVGGVVGLLQYALFTWAESYFEAPLHANVVLLCLVSLSCVHPAYLWWYSRRAENTSATKHDCKKASAIPHPQAAAAKYHLPAAAARHSLNAAASHPAPTRYTIRSTTIAKVTAAAAKFELQKAAAARFCFNTFVCIVSGPTCSDKSEITSEPERMMLKLNKSDTREVRT
ncbi:hypothetical protein ScPMuIL_005101 [Solemya velum]